MRKEETYVFDTVEDSPFLCTVVVINGPHLETERNVMTYREFWKVEIKIEGDWLTVETGLTQKEAERLEESARESGERARSRQDAFYVVPEP